MLCFAYFMQVGRESSSCEVYSTLLGDNDRLSWILSTTTLKQRREYNLDWAFWNVWRFVEAEPYFCSKTKKIHQCIKFILFWNDTLHVSDGLAVHHQDFKSVHTATGICQRDTAICSLASRQQYLFDKCLLLYVQSWTPDDGRKDRPKHVECHFKIK